MLSLPDLQNLQLAQKALGELDIAAAILQSTFDRLLEPTADATRGRSNAGMSRQFNLKYSVMPRMTGSSNTKAIENVGGVDAAIVAAGDAVDGLVLNNLDQDMIDAVTDATAGLQESDTFLNTETLDQAELDALSDLDSDLKTLETNIEDKSEEVDEAIVEEASSGGPTVTDDNNGLLIAAVTLCSIIVVVLIVMSGFYVVRRQAARSRQKRVTEIDDQHRITPGEGHLQAPEAPRRTSYRKPAPPIPNPGRPLNPLNRYSFSHD